MPDLTSRYSHFGISLPKLNIEDIFNLWNLILEKKGPIIFDKSPKYLEDFKSGQIDNSHLYIYKNFTNYYERLENFVENSCQY